MHYPQILKTIYVCNSHERPGVAWKFDPIEFRAVPKIQQIFHAFCLAHIKIYDRAIKILSVGRPIY